MSLVRVGTSPWWLSVFFDDAVVDDVVTMETQDQVDFRRYLYILYMLICIQNL